MQYCNLVHKTPITGPGYGIIFLPKKMSATTSGYKMTNEILAICKAQREPGIWQVLPHFKPVASPQGHPRSPATKRSPHTSRKPSCRPLDSSSVASLQEVCCGGDARRHPKTCNAKKWGKCNKNAKIKKNNKKCEKENRQKKSPATFECAFRLLKCWPHSSPHSLRAVRAVLKKILCPLGTN